MNEHYIDPEDIDSDGISWFEHTDWENHRHMREVERLQALMEEENNRHQLNQAFVRQRFGLPMMATVVDEPLTRERKKAIKKLVKSWARTSRQSGCPSLRRNTGKQGLKQDWLEKLHHS